jgi:hypothetical protein
MAYSWSAIQRKAFFEVVFTFFSAKVKAVAIDENTSPII